ncbi:MAG: thioredoxin domain-containing protein [Patescibacteria group bacterium]
MNMPQRLGSSSPRRVVVFVGVIALIGVYVGYAVVSRTFKNQTRQGAPAPSATMTQEPTPDELAARQNVWTSDDPVRGNIKAQVSIVEFSDFECPYCREEYPIIKQLLDTYGAQVRFQYRDFPISEPHPNAQSAAEAAECASAQGKFWEYHNILFEHQDSLTREDLGRYAREVGLNLKLFNQCLDGRSKTNEVIADFNDGRALGVGGTPTFFINGAKYAGVFTYEELKGIVEELLK